MIIQVFCESDPLRGMNLLQRGFRGGLKKC